MKKLRQVLLSLLSLRKALGFGLFFAAAKNNYHLEIVKKLDFRQVLVLAPHPDDDAFGCGGTLAHLAKAGAKINAAYLCDGAGGTPEGRNEFGTPKKIDKNLIEIRKKETQAAAAILGISSTAFFGYPDGKLAAGSSAIAGIVTLIKTVKPDIILVPSFLDNHPDHRVTNEILLNALSNREVYFTGQIWAYEIWTPLCPNRLVPINQVCEAKKRAIAQHQSQLKTRGYDKAILALNQYRAEINHLDGFAEAFFAASAAMYKELYRNS